MRHAPKAPPADPPKAPAGICQHCGGSAVPFGRYCPTCYGAVLHPDGLPLEPGDPGDPYRAFNAQADAYLLDQQMPSCVDFAIEWQAYQRHLRQARYYDDDHDVLIEARAKALARPGESWAKALARAQRLSHWPRQVLPCQHCQAAYPGQPLLWGWIEVGPQPQSLPDMCGLCESDPRQWRDYENESY